MAPKSSKPSNAVPTAAAIINIAAGLATATIAVAAGEATKTLSAAAALALQTLDTAATKAVSEFPKLQEDIRELRVAQTSQTDTIISVVTGLIKGHTDTEDERLKSISESTGKIEQHMATQNGRLTLVETAITRLNLVLFGIGGPVALIVVGYLLHAAWVKLFG